MKNQKGITLIALVITIIVLIILAAVSIAMLTGDSGILTNASKAEKQTNDSSYADKINMELNAFKAELLADKSLSLATLKASAASLKEDEYEIIPMTGTTEGDPITSSTTQELASTVTAIKIKSKLNTSIEGSISLDGTSDPRYVVTKAVYNNNN